MDVIQDRQIPPIWLDKLGRPVIGDHLVTTVLGLAPKIPGKQVDVDVDGNCPCEDPDIGCDGGSNNIGCPVDKGCSIDKDKRCLENATCPDTPAPGIRTPRLGRRHK